MGELPGRGLAEQNRAAASSFAAQTLSATGTLFANSRDCAVVRTPATSKMSFKPYGMPCNGPRGPMS